MPGTSFAALCESKTAPGVFYTVDQSARVYRSSNAGASWALASIVPAPTNDLATGSESADLVAATGTPVTDSDIHYSTDEASTWNSSIGPAGYWSLVAGDPTTANGFYAARHNEVTNPAYVSVNGGSSWTPCGSLPVAAHASGLVAFPSGGPVLLATDTAGAGPVYRSNDSGSSWMASSTGIEAGEPIEDLMVSDLSAPIAYAAGSAHVYASYDSGTT